MLLDSSALLGKLVVALEEGGVVQRLEVTEVTLENHGKGSGGGCAFSSI